jgi:multidrug resistance efflux pump
VNPDPLPPIPSPPAHHWRQFRVNVLPHVTFFIVLLAVIWLWGRNLANPLLTGQAEGLESDVASPRAGRISQLKVVLYQDVKAGDLIAVVDALDPLILSNTVNLAQAEMNAIRADGGFRPTDQVRYAQLEFDWLNLRAELASLKVEVTLAELEQQRAAKLLADKLISQGEYDIANAVYESKRSAFNEKQEVVTDMGKQLTKLSPASSAESKYISAALALAEAEFHVAEAQLAPVKLLAPISGRVRTLSKLAGATVSTGDPIVTISSQDVDHIVGFLSQPLRLEPKVGERVTVRSRSTQRVEGTAIITHVGPRVELFDSPLRVRGMGSSQQRGLPIIISVPPNLNLLPGELVDLTLDTKTPAEPRL